VKSYLIPSNLGKLSLALETHLGELKRFKPERGSASDEAKRLLKKSS